MPERSDFRSAEEWLSRRGVTREPIRVAGPPPEHAPPPESAPPSEPPFEAHDPGGALPPGSHPGGTASTQAPHADLDDASSAGGQAPYAGLDDEVTRAVAFIRRSTAAQPAAEDRLRAKLADRDVPRAAVDLALQQARREGLVDDTALAAALVAERRSKGHAPARIRKDLRRRGLPDELIDQQLAATEREDPEAVAFGVARDKAPAYASLEPETAFRRLVGYLARRGHPEGLARKVAREVVYVEREQQRVAGH